MQQEQTTLNVIDWLGSEEEVTFYLGLKNLGILTCAKSKLSYRQWKFSIRLFYESNFDGIVDNESEKGRTWQQEIYCSILGVGPDPRQKPMRRTQIWGTGLN